MHRLMRTLQVVPIAALLVLAGAAHQVHALPVIQEVLYDGPGGDADDVFTELIGAAGSSLDGWELVGVNGADGAEYATISLDGLVFPSDGILVIVTSSANAPLAAVSDHIDDAVDWQNGAPDAVWLRNGGTVVDALQYGGVAADGLGEGDPAPDVPAGSSLSRDSSGTDTDDNFSDFIATSTPTPGSGVTPVAVEMRTWGAIRTLYR